MKVKKTLLLLSIPLLLAFAIIVFIALPWLLIFIGIQLEPNPPQPEITYGKFPFRLEYEINGQRKVIQDTLICEYDGIGSNEGQGKYRKWKERLASGNEKITLLKVNNTKEIYYSPGSANYYMGDLGDSRKYEHFFPDALLIEKNGIGTSNGIILADELLDKYHIKLISWDYTPPIKNNFPATK
ncbi:hypothetical protein ACFQ5D_02480 [Paenibacillus farraposensis]|uniref:Uncharacterized protein n=1 Tax=Paenibacillus farraposensis TaxID=2807095 RepID=A0ABW4D9C6_9BACL|nr:hypothetical protein [Paenibacillus farraposensis]MCC3381765.1 hypothetical protein [Paenibacillus farraposensis]